MDPTLVLTVTEAAKALGLPRQETYRLCREGRLPVIRRGRRWVVPRASLPDWLRLLADDNLLPAPVVSSPEIPTDKEATG